MAEQKTKRYLELQMEELKATYVTEEENEKPKKKRDNSRNAEIAKLYDDAAEYEEDLKGFEEELEIVNANTLENIAKVLKESFPDEERDYAQELNSIIETGWHYFVQELKSHPKEQLVLVKETNFVDVLEKLTNEYPHYEGDFEVDIRGLLVKRWENLIAIKKEHIKQELEEIYTAGLKPKYVKRVYEKFHGLV